MLRHAVQNVAEELELLSQNSYEVIDDALVLTQGLPAVRFDEDRLVERITEAFLQGAHEPVDYHDASTTEIESMDVEAIYAAIFAEPKNAYFNIETDKVAEHVVGMSFDLDLAERMLGEALP